MSGLACDGHTFVHSGLRVVGSFLDGLYVVCSETRLRQQYKTTRSPYKCFVACSPPRLLTPDRLSFLPSFVLARRSLPLFLSLCFSCYLSLSYTCFASLRRSQAGTHTLIHLLCPSLCLEYLDLGSSQSLCHYPFLVSKQHLDSVAVCCPL